MNVLLTHAWLRGNLGDFCITRQCVQGVRAALPGCKISLLSEPCADWDGKQEIASLVDCFLEESYRTDLSHLFMQADAVINVPGGGLQNRGDRRGRFMLRDARICRRIGVPHIFASHSFHPYFDASAVQQSLFVAREPATAALLRLEGCAPVSAADLAFLEPMPERGVAQERALLFLRFDHFKKISLTGRTLILDDRTVELPNLPLVLASSDPRRDSPLLRKLSDAWHVPYEPSENLPQLLSLIANSSYVVSDRYHPVIFAFMSGVPFDFLERKGSLRDRGLTQLFHAHSSAELKAMAEKGMESLCAVLHSSVSAR